MKIFLYCHSMTFGFGGMEKTVANLANYLSTQKYEVAIGHYNREGGSLAYPLHDNIELIDWNEDNADMLLVKTKLFSPDVIIIFGAGKYVRHIVAVMRILNIPIIIHEGTNPERCISANWMEPHITRGLALWQRELTYFEAKYVRFTVDIYKKSLSSIFSKRAVAFPNAFEAVKMDDHKIEKKVNRIINIGGLKKNKNIFPLLAAFAQIASDFPDWELAIFSHAPKKGVALVNRVRSFIEKNNLESQIILYPPTENIHLEYKKSDIHAIMSESEGLPNAVAESMVYGIPSIGFAHCPGVNSLIHDGENGILIEKDKDPAITVNRIAEALRRLMSNEDLRKQMGQQALMQSSMFNPEYVYANWLKIINASANSSSDESLSEQEREIALHYLRKRELFWDEMLSFFSSKDLIKLSTKILLFPDKKFFEKKEEMANDNISEFKFF